MRKICNVLFFLTLFSCNGQSGEKIKLVKQNACSILTNKEVAELLNVAEQEVLQQNMGMSKKRSICYYYTKNGKRKLFIRMAWKSEKAVAKKVLQQQFESYLLKGEKNIPKYKEVTSTEYVQILFGIGQDFEGKYLHILRKRFGNKAEVQFELTQEFKDEKIESKLVSLLKKL